MYKLVEGRDFTLKGGVPGFIYKDSKGNSQWLPIDTETFPKAELDRLLKDYQRRSGPEKIEREIKIRADLEAQQRARQPKPPSPPPTPSQPPSSTPATPSQPPTASTTPPAPPQGSSTPQAPRSPVPAPPAAPPVRPPAPPQGSSTPQTPRSPVPAPPAAPSPTPAPKPQPTLDDLRSASARATMAGPSREAQSLMSPRTRALLGQSRLNAGIRGQQDVETMRSSMTSPTSSLPNPNAEWAKANPKLAAAYAERQRIRGTSQTDNPQIDSGMRSRMQMTPTVQSPTLQRDLGNLASRYTSLTGNVNTSAAPRPKTPTTTAAQGVRSATTTAAQGVRSATTTASQPGSKIDNAAIQRIQSIPLSQTPTSTPTPTSTGGSITLSPTFGSRTLMKTDGKRNPILFHYEYEPYDIILEYLLSKGHAEDLTEANYIMLEMDESSISNILGTYQDYLLAEEISEWVDTLIDQGHDLSGYNWDEIVEYYVNESR